MRAAGLTIRKAPKQPGLQRLKRGSIAKAKQPPPRHPREEKRAISFLWAVSILIKVRSIRSTATFLLGLSLYEIRMWAAEVSLSFFFNPRNALMPKIIPLLTLE